ncbi:MAG: hypothetical protein V1790_07125 [Planctomycetota bacterium]
MKPMVAQDDLHQPIREHVRRDFITLTADRTVGESLGDLRTRVLQLPGPGVVEGPARTDEVSPRRAWGGCGMGVSEARLGGPGGDDGEQCWANVRHPQAPRGEAAKALQAAGVSLGPTVRFCE